MFYCYLLAYSKKTVFRIESIESSCIEVYIHVALLDKFPQLGKFGIGGLNLPWRPNEEKLYPDSSMPKTLSHEQKKGDTK